MRGASKFGGADKEADRVTVLACRPWGGDARKEKPHRECHEVIHCIKIDLNNTCKFSIFAVSQSSGTDWVRRNARKRKRGKNEVIHPPFGVDPKDDSAAPHISPPGVLPDSSDFIYKSSAATI